ncbi:MAG: PIN domain-containing protein [Burkholderiales bacterium]|nr:PIN domain-containing protein [Burkholderiales bacterium]
MRAFFDSNVLVYAFDVHAPGKQRTARDRFELHARAGDAILSSQVLSEFFVTITRKLKLPVPHGDAARLVRDLARLPVVAIDAELVQRAIEWSRRHDLAYWDALIVAAASSGGATALISEDLQHGQTIEGVRIVNPFVETAAG